MALPSGRVGVNRKQVDSNGNILGGGSYTLPIATENKLGGVKPVEKNNSMTKEVGVDAEGKLWVEPSEGGGGIPEYDLIDVKPTASIRADVAVFFTAVNNTNKAVSCQKFTLFSDSARTQPICSFENSDGLDVVMLRNVPSSETGSIYYRQNLNDESNVRSWGSASLTPTSVNINNTYHTISAVNTGISSDNDDYRRVGGYKNKNAGAVVLRIEY